MDRRTESGSGSDFGQQLRNLGSSFVAYLRTRQPEHWLFFALGVIVGLLIG
jgi:4-hydroxybenzoate polyprenyltransferase